MKRSIRPTNIVRVGGNDTARVRKCGKRRQGGAWVRVYELSYERNSAIRTVRSDLVRPALV